MRLIRWETGIPIVVFLGLSTLAWIGWRQDVRVAESAIQDNNRLLAAAVGDRLAAYIKERANDLNSLRQARFAGMMSNGDQFHLRAEGLRANHPEFGTITWIDSHGTVKWSVGQNGRDQFTGTDIGALPVRIRLLAEARASETAVLSPVMKILDSNLGIEIVLAVPKAGQPDGYLAVGLKGSSLIINAVPAAYRNSYNVVFSESGRDIAVSDGSPRRLTGLHVRRIMQRSFTVHVWPSSRAKIARHYQAAMLGFLGNMAMATIVGSVLFVAIRQRGQALRRSEERKGIADALHVSEKRLMDIVEESPWAIIEHSPATGIIDVNPAAEKLYKLSKLEMIGHQPAEWIHPEDLERTMRRLRMEGSGKAAPYFENRNIDKDGGIHYMRWTGARRLDAQGNVTGVISFGLDITAEAEVSEARERLLKDEQLLIERLWALNDLARNLRTTFDRTNLYQFAVRAVSTILSGRMCAILLFDFASRELEVVEAANMPDSIGRTGLFARGTRFRMDDAAFGENAGLSIQRPVHDIRELQGRRVEALADAGIKSRAMVPIIVDSAVAGFITLYSNSESVPAALPHELEFVQGVAEHLALALTNSRLYFDLKNAYTQLHDAQSQIVQMEKLRAIGEMASGIAHDFNNSLAAVLGYAELLESECLEGKAKQYLRQIQKAAGDATNTVRRIQGYTRRVPEPGSSSRVYLNAMVNESIALTVHKWRDQAQSRGATVRIETDLGDADLHVQGHPSELREVLANLIFNAVDSIERDGEVLLKTAARSGSAIITVQDTGCGMTEEIRGRAFDPFFTTKGVEGSGLGLSVSYGIVGRHGGEIRASSVPGAGSTFEVLLPMAGGEPLEPIESSVRADTACRRALVIDDDEAVLDVIASLLRNLGTEVDVAGNGIEGIELMKHDNYEVLFTDLGMPGMSGREVAVSAKASVPGIKVVLLTGWGEKLRSTGDTPEGVDLILSKPVRMDDLRRALAIVCSAHPEVRPRNRP